MPVISAAILLFLVMDPLGNIPLFLSALKDVERARRRRIIVRELVIALAVLVLFLFSGKHILAALQISETSLSIAGGIVLFLISIRMIFPVMGGVFGGTPEGEPFIVPLAIPLVAGPSTLATVLLLAAREPGRGAEWLLALVCAWLISAVILLLSDNLHRFFGARGLVALERLMGLILTTVAVEMFLTGVDQFFSR
jgi:small neutral amino acid transporter SnatA (MarC family)